MGAVHALPSGALVNDPLLTILSERLDSDPAMGSDSVALVLAACEGADELEAVLIGGRARERKPGSEAPRPEEPGAYLRSVTVEGFRGIGPPATLELTPGPGLTLVVGRNGSGKSSFAEGLEVLLTGDSRRWSHHLAGGMAQPPPSGPQIDQRPVRRRGPGPTSRCVPQVVP